MKRFTRRAFTLSVVSLLAACGFSEVDYIRTHYKPILTSAGQSIIKNDGGTLTEGTMEAQIPDGTIGVDIFGYFSHEGLTNEEYQISNNDIRNATELVFRYRVSLSRKANFVLDNQKIIVQGVPLIRKPGNEVVVNNKRWVRDVVSLPIPANRFKTLTVTFLPGAIRIDGVDVAVSPMTFRLTTEHLSGTVLLGPPV
jgi:hypothetical protein